MICRASLKLNFSIIRWFSFSFFNAYLTVLGARLVFFTISLWVIAPPSLSIARTVLDDGGRCVPDIQRMLTPLTDKGIGYYLPAHILHDMLTRQERNAFILLALVTLAVFIGALIMESLGKSAFSTRFTRLSPDGSLVLLEGRVEKLVLIEDGGHMIITVNGTPVFIPGPVAAGVSVKIGEPVAVYGLVQTYRGEKEVIIQQSGDIRTI
jgi:hypothetical protein